MVHWPRYRNPHTHTRVLERTNQIKKWNKKTFSCNGEWVQDRDKYISAVRLASVRSTTKNTDAIFTAYVIEHWRARGVCVSAESDARVRRIGGGIFRWKCFEFRHYDIRAQSLSWFCRIERFGDRASDAILMCSRPQEVPRSQRADRVQCSRL